MTLSDYPNELPSINMDFRNSRQMDPRIPFTRASAAGVIGEGTGNVNGEVYTFQENVPRLTERGLLLEKQSTNLLLHSVGLDAGKWASQFSTGGSNNWQTNVAGVVAPDGIAGEVASLSSTNTASNGTYRSYYSNGNLTTTAYTFSCFLKANGINSVVLLIDIAWGQGRSEFTLVGEGTATPTTANTTANIDYIGNGWYHCSTSQVLTVTRADCAIAVNTPGDGTSGIYVWGAQLENLPGPTSYIPTTTATVTRAADYIQVPIANFGDDFLVNGPGTFVCTASKTDYVGPFRQVIFTLDGRPMEPTFGEAGGSPDLKLYSAGAPGFDIQSQDYSNRATFVGSVQRTPAICNRAVSTGASQANTGGTLWPSTVGNWYIGNYLGNNTASPFNGWIERIAYYPVVMDLDQVEALAGL